MNSELVSDHENNLRETQEETSTAGVEKRLGDLMMRGWTMLAESCPIDTCGCPLMRNFDGQKYCCGCEMWHFDKDRKVKQKFGELVSLKGKQNIQVKENRSVHTEVSKLPSNIKISFSNSVIQALQMKLAYLANTLNTESDLSKTKDILECMRLCMDNIMMAKSMDSQ
jgi:uncharacterized Zn finger protein (UPF0148 family)